jgi:hypothetical protein
VLYRGEGAKPTLAVSYFHRAYDGGAPEFDYGSPSNSLLLLARADVKGFHLRCERFFHGIEASAGASRPIRPVTDDFASVPAPFYPVWRNLALHAAIA